jgi:hypothetical protein
MLVLNISLLNRKYILINVLKALSSIISTCNVHVTFLSNITPRYFVLSTNGIFRLFSERWDSAVDDCVHRLSESESRVTLRPEVYRRSVRLRAKPLDIHGQNFFSIEHLRS